MCNSCEMFEWHVHSFEWTMNSMLELVCGLYSEENEPVSGNECMIIFAEM